ncbi:hypothetical protein WJX79_010546 [Trebouxia sp. C0005]
MTQADQSPSHLLPSSVLSGRQSWLADPQVLFMDESAVDICAICLSAIGGDSEQAAEEAFLDNCYHRFHRQCVMSWTTAQKAHPSVGSVYSCPLCKAPYTSVLHSFQDNTFRQEWVMPGPHPSSLILTPQQRRRRLRHRRPAGNAAMKVRYSKMSSLQMQRWVDNMAAAVSPFSTDHAVKFAQELLGFLSSNLSITGHDLFVFGEDVQPSQAHQNRQSGHELASFVDQDRSSTSTQSSQGGISDNDSEAYVSLGQMSLGSDMGQA